MSDKDEATRPVCKLTECQGKPRCRMCLAMDARYTAPPAESERIAALESALKQAGEALGALLTHMGMDEDEWNKPTFDQARDALRAIEEAKR